MPNLPTPGEMILSQLLELLTIAVFFGGAMWLTLREVAKRAPAFQTARAVKRQRLSGGGSVHPAKTASPESSAVLHEATPTVRSTGWIES